MAQFLVLRDYQDTKRKLPAGALVDDATTTDIADMVNAGLAAVVFDAATMEAPRQRFLSQQATEHGRPDLVVLILLSNSGASLVKSSTGATTESRLNP